MNSLINLIARTLVRGEVYRVMRRSKGATSLVLAVVGGIVVVAMQTHR